MRQGVYAVYFGFTCTSCCAYSYLFIFFYNKKIYFLLKKKETGSGLLRGEGIKKFHPRATLDSGTALQGV